MTQHNCCIIYNNIKIIMDYNNCIYENLEVINKSNFKDMKIHYLMLKDELINILGMLNNKMFNMTNDQLKYYIEETEYIKKEMTDIYLTIYFNQ